MKIKFYFLIAGMLLFITSCSIKDLDVENTSLKHQEALLAQPFGEFPGAVQISGIGVFADPETCDYEGEGALFALAITGDLEGCLFVYVDEYDCSPSGTYRESGREHFIGSYNGEEGSFWTSYKFEAKYEGCSEEGFFLGAEIFGRCQHPLVKDSGEGAFEGMTGRIDFKDDVESGLFYMRGHLK